MAEYRVTVNRDLKVIDRPWDGDAARARIFDRYTGAGGELDANAAADFFLIADPSTGLKSDLHMPVGDIVDGERVINASALRAALSRLGQGFPLDVPADVRERAQATASELLDEHRERVDGDDSRLGVMIPIPTRIQKQFPRDLKDQPHVTMVFAGAASLAQRDAIVEIVREESAGLAGETLRLGPLGHFDNDQRIAYASVLVPDAVAEARNRIAQRVAEFMQIPRVDEWVPHATLAYLSPNTAYVGPVPEGEWELDQIQIWHAGDRVLVTLIDTVQPGARADARTDEEKAEIRSRWAAGEGPNMGPAGHREWLETPFSGPNRKTGEERERARKHAEQAQRIMAKSTADWTDEDYDGAVEIMAYIARATEQDQGDPIVIDGREGPSPNRAALMDWGYDPKIAKRGDAVQAELPLFAPAVHTQSRNLIENVYRADRAEYLTDPDVDLGIDLDIGHTALSNGWARYPVLYSRVGCQRYVINGREVIEYRSPEEVFSEASMRSGWGIPWELRHSADLLTPQTVLGVACGTTLTVAPYKDGIHTCGYAHAWDEELRRSIDTHTAGDVSVAFRCKVDPRPGHDDFGQRFDRRQVEIIWNSLASEPRGRAGTARVLTSRADATDGVFVDSASAMLALARSERPSKPVYYDPNHFRRLDSSDVPAPPPAKRTPKKDADMTLLSLLMQAKGLENAAVAEMLGVSEADLMAMIDGSAEMSDDQMTRLVEVLVPRGEMPAAEVEVNVEDMSDEVKKTLEERVAMLERAVSDANKRADAADKAVKERDTKIAGMVSEADAVKRADAARAEGEARALHAGTAITLAQRALGFDWHPGLVRGEDGSWTDGGERKDADGNPIHVTIKDWQRGAILGAFGDDEGAKVLADIDAAPDSAYDYVMGLRLKDAAKRLDARDLQCDDLRNAIERTGRNAVNDKNRQDAEEEDRIQALIKQQQETASAVRTQGAA